MAKNQSKSIYSGLNALSAMGLTLVNGLLGIVVTRLILQYYGSDFNGLNSTANQVVHVLLIVEGGFTTASNVALFGPTTRNEQELCNGILAATMQKFHRIGTVFFLVGTVVAVAYGFAANSGLPTEFIITVIMMTMIPPAFNLYYATTYRVVLQSQQKEYVISLYTTATIGLGHLCNIGMMLLGGPMWMIRVNTMTFALLNSFLIAGFVKRSNPQLNLNVEPRPDLIKGTADVMVQRISSVIYDSSPLIFLSVSPSGGTVLASVYAVYNNVFIIVKSLIRAIIDAPRLSIGQLLAQRKREDVWPVFAQYQFAAFSAVFVMLTTTCALIVPFVKLYTDGISDADYVDHVIAVMLVAVSTAEMLHMPSSHLLNMAGEFKVCKRIQILTCAVLLTSMTVGGLCWGIYGMLGALMLTTLFLDILEMGYVHLRFFEGKLLPMLGLVLPLLGAGVLVCALELRLDMHVTSYLTFIMLGVIFVCVNGLAVAVVGLVFNRRVFLALVRRVLRIVKVLK